MIQANAEKSMLSLELSQLQAKHEAEMKKLRQEHKKAVHAMKVDLGVNRIPLNTTSPRSMQVEELRMFREMVAGFEEEKTSLEAKLTETGKLLQSAVNDIMTLSERNAELERQLVIAAAWEPPPRVP